MTTANTYTVWVGGIEITDYLLPFTDATRLAQAWREAGWDDVVVEAIHNNNERNNS